LEAAQNPAVATSASGKTMKSRTPNGTKLKIEMVVYRGVPKLLTVPPILKKAKVTDS
jgi:hypothetical protein